MVVYAFAINIEKSLQANKARSRKHNSLEADSSSASVDSQNLVDKLLVQMESVVILLLLQTCLAVDYRVGERTTFYRFDFTPPVTKVTASSPAIKSGDCKREEFCYQIFNASRGAIVRGTISEPVSAVIFYLRRSSTPRAIVITRKDAQNKEPTLPRGTIVDKRVDLEAGYHFEYLVIFKNEVEKIDVSGGAQLAGGSTPSATLDVYSPLYLKDPRSGLVILMSGYIEKTPMSFQLQYANGGTQTFNFYSRREYGAIYRGYSISDFNSVASVNPLWWVTLAGISLRLLHV
ncbi:hypothetical protein SprV_0802533700 [Sparganum proliferum]